MGIVTHYPVAWACDILVACDSSQSRGWFSLHTVDSQTGFSQLCVTAVAVDKGSNMKHI